MDSGDPRDRRGGWWQPGAHRLWQRRPPVPPGGHDHQPTRARRGQHHDAGDL